MIDAELKSLRAERLGVAVLVALLHLVAIVALIRAFAPDLSAAVLRPAVQAIDIAIRVPAPIPEPTPRPSAASSSRAPAQSPGAAAPAGKKADPRTVIAPPPKIALSPVAAPPVTGIGSADSAGARAAGQGTGAGGTGTGIGAGAAGPGAGGGGGAAKVVKIAGDIFSARDYPKATRELRLGTSVTIVLTVGIDGRVSDCRISRPSRDAEADRITCRLATERFRFRPARDAAGEAVASTYGWQQRWFAPIGA